MFKDKMKSVLGAYTANKDEIKENVISKIGTKSVAPSQRSPLKKALTTYAAFLITVILISGGIVVAAEAAEYNKAVTYLTAQGISIEDMTRREVITLYRSERRSASASSDTFSDMHSVILSDIPSKPDTVTSDASSATESPSSVASTPPVESNSSVNSEEPVSGFGDLLMASADGSLFYYQKTEGENYIYTVCLYDKINGTYEILDRSTVAISDDPYEHGFFTDHWYSDKFDVYFYLNYFENRIGYFIRSTKKTGFLPIDDPEMAHTVYFTPQMQYSRFNNLYVIGNSICWIETNYTVGEEEDTVYIYDPETEAKTMLFKSSYGKWIDAISTTSEELYIKTAMITEQSCDMEGYDPTGDLYYYNSSDGRLIMIAKDIYYFTLDNGEVYVKNTEDSELEKLVPLDPKTVVRVRIYPYAHISATVKNYTTDEKINVITSVFDDIATEKITDDDPDPEEYNGTAMSITFYCADGSEKEIYVLDDYICIDDGDWEKMTSYSESDIQSIIANLPTDA